MAVLTADQLAELRRQLEAEATPNQTKATLNLALQAVEDYFETTARAGINAAINSATSPITLPGALKLALVKYWLYQKFVRGG